MNQWDKGKSNRQSTESLNDILQGTAEMLGGRLLSHQTLTLYASYLQGISLDAVRRACLTLLDTCERGNIPAAKDIKRLAQQYASEGEQGYLECQDHRCESLIPWPTDRTDEGRMYCPRNQPVNGGPEDAATLDEKIEIAKALTPKARAFLRSALPHLMADIPVSLEESEWTETEDKYKLVKERKPASAEVIAESYGANVDDVRRAQHNANTRTLTPL